MDHEKCVIPRCREPAHIKYIERNLCQRHWQLLADAELGSEGEVKLMADIGLVRDPHGEVVSLT